MNCNGTKCHFPLIGLETEFLSAHSRISESNYGLYPRSQGRSDLLNISKTTRRFPSSWRAYRRLSLIIWSVRELGTVLDADRGSR